MSKKSYAYYPGCSSQKGASASNFVTSLGVMLEKLGIQLNEVPDWNCCGTSIGYGEGGELPRLAFSARNLALSEQHLPGQDMVHVCPACWLASRETAERLHASPDLAADTAKVLKEAGLTLKNEVKPRHILEVLIEDIGWEGMRAPVQKPLEGIKFAGYVGCQTNRPFGICGESFENPQYLDKIIETMGGEAVPYDQKVTCCGGALAFSEPEKSHKQIRDIIESAADNGADAIVTPCQLCQANVELYQDAINKKHGTNFKMPVLYYTELMSVAYGGTVKETGLGGHLIRCEKLESKAAG